MNREAHGTDGGEGVVGQRPEAGGGGGGVVFGLAIFLGAFLLFFVEPVAGRRLLPRFGGGPWVWLTCLLFFQGVLLTGYLYAHGMVRRLSMRAQVWVHLGLMVAAIFLVNWLGRREGAGIGEGVEGGGFGGPQVAILLEMLKMIGLPFVLLAASSPLLQAWYHRCYPRREAYRLYALSNVGSLGALVGYVVLVEPRLTLGQQEWLWVTGLVVFVVVVAGCGMMAMKAVRGAGADELVEKGRGKRGVGRGVGVERGAILSWVVLAAWPSVMLMAVTYALTVDVAPVPFLWLLPLGLYLLTLIICFDHSRWYGRRVWLPLAVLALALMAWWLWEQERSGYVLGTGFVVPLLIMCGGLFVAGMVCHGELVRRKPAAGALTVFYLAVSGGGFLGGVFVSVLAPLLFTGLWEMPIGIFGTAVTIWLLVAPPWGSGGGQKSKRKGRAKRGKRSGRLPGGEVPRWVSWGLGLWVILLGWGLLALRSEYASDHLAEKRSFFGILAVGEAEEGLEGWYRWLVHGSIDHGGQFQSEGYRSEAVAYYGPASGAALAIGRHPKRRPAFAENGMPIRIGVAGLGAGGIAALAKRGDFVRFFEIDPQVEVFAREYFSYLEDSEAEVVVQLGDARLSLAREEAGGEEASYDVLLMDAFSGDAIPVHLATREACALYWERLEPDGILGFNITNQYVDLLPVMEGLAAEFGKQIVVVNNSEVPSWRIYESTWVLMTSNEAFLKVEAGVNFERPAKREAPEGAVLWTDDYSSVWNVLRVFRREDGDEDEE